MLHTHEIVLVLLGALVLAPWAVMTAWWYVALFYYLFLHREAASSTDRFAVKVLTTGDDAAVLATTLSYCSRVPQVISRRPVRLPRGDLKVMPSSFTCTARYKAQQLEWARRLYPAERTLYLDEDSLFGWHEIPKGDIVQFQELPVSGHPLIRAMEAYRMGFQLEQALFERTGPLYLWGGGVAIAGDLENETTWDRPSITEDTAFVFAVRRPYRFIYSKRQVYAQAPLTIGALVQQRWRWASGTYHDARYLGPGLRKVFVYFRTVQWGLWPVGMLAPLFLGLPWWISLSLGLQAAVWSFAGTRQMRLSWIQTIVVVALTPVSSCIHSLGSSLALISPKKTFTRTPKSIPTPVAVERVLDRRRAA